MSRFIFITMFVLINFIPSISFGDCIGCYDFVKVEIVLNNGRSLNGYVYEDVEDKTFEIIKIAELLKNYRYSFIPDYIDLNSLSINNDLTRAFEYDIFINIDSIKKINPSEIVSIKEFSRTTKGLIELNSNDYNLLKNKNSRMLRSVGIGCGDNDIGYMVFAITYSSQYNNHNILDVFNDIANENNCTVRKIDNNNEFIESDEIYMTCDDNCSEAVEYIKHTYENSKNILFLIKEDEGC